MPLDLLQKFRKKDLTDKSIYMSSVADPYQPIEREIKSNTEFVGGVSHAPSTTARHSNTTSHDYPRHLFMKGFEKVQVKLTTTTDIEKVRRVFEPLCP